MKSVTLRVATALGLQFLGLLIVFLAWRSWVLRDSELGLRGSRWIHFLLRVGGPMRSIS